MRSTPAAPSSARCSPGCGSFLSSASSWSFRIGAVANLIVSRRRLALSAFFEARASRSRCRISRAANSRSRRSSEPRQPPIVHTLVLLTFAVSGFASFALEIVWFRLLVVLLMPTTYAFTVMLATVLAGIAFGRRWRRRS